ncbi:MAG TPA: molybdopterin-dependent oxidoreductase [Nitrospiria bacterium]|nr:molybdopterin-dependent oxidoreductase [Nitrospiria bacterium]
MRREGIKPPKFADQFARIDFEAEPLPVLCLYPIPGPVGLESLRISVCGLDGQPRFVSWTELGDLPRIRTRAPIICQIFNWSEEVEWEGVRLSDFLDHVGLETASQGHYAIYSRDGHYFETLTRTEARDPRVLLAYGLNGQPLPEPHGAPLRLVVPFLQGFKSVKWVRSIRAFRRDPLGIKKLRGQSRSAELGEEWRRRYGMNPPDEPGKRPS